MILVVGGTGTVGRLVLESIAAADFETRALVRDLEKARALKLATVQFAQGDLADPASLAPALDRVEKVVLISRFSQDMVRLQTNLVEAAARAPSRPHIIKLSGSARTLMRPPRWGGGMARSSGRSRIPACPGPSCGRPISCRTSS